MVSTMFLAAAEAEKSGGTLAEKLVEKMDLNTVFEIPIFGGIPVKESIVVSWIVIAFLGLLAFLLTRGFRTTNISKRQAFFEFAVTWLQDLVKNMIGEEGVKYVPYLVTVLLYIGCSNIAGLFGFKPPTKDLMVTAALAIMSIVLVEAAGIKHKGVLKWAKGFAEPIWIIFPINIMEIAIRPLSLCMRLFGNVLGAFVIMEMIDILIPVGIPLVFSFYFDLFDGLLQAYVFVFLTSLYIKEIIEMEE